MLQFSLPVSYFKTSMICLCVYVCIFLIQAQFSPYSSMSSPYDVVGGGYYGGWYGDRSCPVSLLSQLSSIVSTLFGYGQDYSPYTGVFAGSSIGQSYSPLSAARGYQTTGNPYNPTCPWPLINGMIAQIQTYVNQLQSAQTGSVSASNPFPFTGVSPLSRGVPGLPGLPGVPFAGGFRGVKK